MDGWYALFVLFVFPPTLAMTRGWWVWAQDRRLTGNSGIRRIFTLFGLFAATSSLILEVTFLLHGYHGRGSFGGGPAGIWIVVGRLAGVFFILTLIAAIFGKGGARWWMVVYCGLIAFSALGLIQIAYD